MKKTGELLRKAREEKGLSINEIGLSLKISNRILSAIEDGDLSRLPAKTFLRGFVQSYANYLKMNSDEVLEVFREEMGTTQPQPIIEPAIAASATAPEKETLSTPEKSPIEQPRPALSTSGPSFKGLLISVVCIFLVVCIYGVKRVIERYQRETVTEAVEVISPLPEPAPAEVLTSNEESISADQSLPPLAVVPATPPMSSEPEQATNSEPEPAASAKPAPAPTVPEKPVQAAAPSAPAPAPVPAQTPPPAAAPPVAEKKEEAKPEVKPQGRPLELVIEALDTVEVEYSNAAGEVVERLKLSADQVHTIRGRQGLKLKVSNGGAVNVILNGKDMGVAGDLGKPATLTY